MLTAWAAVSVCETICELTGFDSTIKWPNDVIIKGRKVCGILIEQRTVNSGQELFSRDAPAERSARASRLNNAWPLATICGIGLNLNQSASEFRLAGIEQAGSLSMFANKHFDCDAAARLLIKHLDDEYDRMCQGHTQSLEIRWAEGLNLLNRLVTAECIDGQRQGIVTTIGWDAVSIETAAGPVILQPEAIRHLHPAHC
jgi:BirA family biotin operon repressor/biotin-[acetyl-CoA-carboxylase] ligase